MIYLSPIDSVHLIWPHLEASLNRVREKTGERWTPAYVFSRIVDGRAGLFRLHEEGRHLAYVVVERLDGYEVALNVWIVEGDGMTKEVVGAFVQLMDELTKRVGASLWKLTGRKGWGRALAGYVKPVATVYERVLT